jgi:hypothetical protein
MAILFVNPNGIYFDPQNLEILVYCKGEGLDKKWVKVVLSTNSPLLVKLKEKDSFYFSFPETRENRPSGRIKFYISAIKDIPERPGEKRKKEPWNTDIFFKI